jgi:hypothetical protein
MNFRDRGIRSLAAACVLPVLIAGCGGGGDGDGAGIGGSATAGAGNPSPVTVSIQQALAYEAVHGLDQAFTTSGWDEIQSYALSGGGTLAEGPATIGALRGQGALLQTQVLTSTLALNGVSTANGSSDLVYRDPHTYATIAEDDGSDFIAYRPAALPTSVVAGDTGQMATGTIYGDSTLATVIGSVTVAYAVSADTSSSLVVSFISQQYDTFGQPTVTGRTSYRVTTAGVASLVSVAIANTGALGSTGGDSPYAITYTFGGR